jgi:predicted RNA-binding Zn-ribbon protein involved in translation (DUF1610 family)
VKVHIYLIEALSGRPARQTPCGPGSGLFPNILRKAGFGTIIRKIGIINPSCQPPGTMLRCPVCGSTTIYPVTGGVFGQVYRCKECGYRGSFVLETDDEETGSNKESQEESREKGSGGGKRTKEE